MTHLTVIFPFIPASAKNRRRLFRAGKALKSLPSEDCAEHQKQIGALAREVYGKLGGTWAGDHYVGMAIEVDEQAKETVVTIHDLGSQPAKGRCDTKRDVHGVVETIADGLEGHAFDDDRQMRYVVVNYIGWDPGVDR